MFNVQKRPFSESSTSVLEVKESRPFKKVRISKQPVISQLINNYLLELEKCSNSNTILDLLINISENINAVELDSFELTKKLLEIYTKENISSIRCKIMTIFGDILASDDSKDVNNLMNDIIALLTQEESSNVLAQGLLVLHRISEYHPNQSNAILDFAKSQLPKISFIVQKQAIFLLGSIVPNSDVGTMNLKLICMYTDSEDARVRSQAFNSILKIAQHKIPLDPELYSRATNALQDDYECVRKEALQLVYELGLQHPEHLIKIPDSNTELRLIDAAFGKVCSSICDLSMQVRAQAAQLLGGMHSVSSEFLHQTLDKKLMSNLRRKKSFHERSMEHFVSGEWSTGKKWADDAPKEQIATDSISLMESGACGALVHGLEDEFLEVRTASVESMCQLALINTQYAVSSLDFLVDMFNDEIESVRLKSIHSLTAISKHIILREDQLETMLSALEDFSAEIREGLHVMLGACKFSTQNCLTMVVQKILDVLSKYPQDKLSAYGCLQKVGQKHAEICISLAPQLLQDHPFFDSAEKDVEDPAYVSILILLFNAAQHMPSMVSLFPETTIKHYAYLRDTMPNLVPNMALVGQISTYRELKLTETTGSLQFLETLLNNIEAASTVPRARQALLEAAQNNLDRLAAIDPSLSGTAHFTAAFLGVHLSIEILESCISENFPAKIKSKDSQNQLIKNCLKLQNIFSGLNLENWLMVKQICMRASALNIIFIVKDRSQSALAPCQLLLYIANDLKNFLQSNPSMIPDEFTASVLQQLDKMTEPKPGRVFREILPFFQKKIPLVTPKINLNVKMCYAEIIDPSSYNATENVIKVTAGLIAAVPLVANLHNLYENQRNDLRIRIKYPDQNLHYTVPRKNDLKRIFTEHGEENTNWKLRTTVLLSHGIWTESAKVELTICLAVKLGTELELCKPLKLMFSPKPVKKGSIS